MERLREKVGTQGEGFRKERTDGERERGGELRRGPREGESVFLGEQVFIGKLRMAFWKVKKSISCGKETEMTAGVGFI